MKEQIKVAVSEGKKRSFIFVEAEIFGPFGVHQSTCKSVHSVSHVLSGVKLASSSKREHLVDAVAELLAILPKDSLFRTEKRVAELRKNKSVKLCCRYLLLYLKIRQNEELENVVGRFFGDRANLIKLSHMIQGSKPRLKGAGECPPGMEELASSLDLLE